MTNRVWWMGLALAMSAGCSDDGAQLCKSQGVTGPCIGLAPGASDKSAQEAFVKIAEGGTIVFGAATYKFANQLNLSTKNVTIAGQGMDKTILDFGMQVGSEYGILANRDGVTIRDLTVQNTYGDAIKVVGATGVTFKRVHVLWQSQDLPNHGAYGLYPVQCTSVLVDESIVEGAADAGIYVGQSNQIVVRKSTAQGNVAGIEIENSHNADVMNNTATGNTGGILVFALPDLSQVDTNTVRVFDNMILTNNHPSFAAIGSIVGNVPAGTGMLIMAANSVEVFHNTFVGNGMGHVGVVSYFLADQAFDPTMHGAYYPWAQSVWIHDNTFTGGGDNPDTATLLGNLLKLSFDKAGISPISTVLYDGLVDPMHTSTTGKNQMDLCLSANGTITFANLQADMLAANMGLFPIVTDVAPYSCTLTPLPAVSFPGL